MGIAYKELFREKDRVYGFGPAGYFIRRFKKSDYSEAELLDFISGMDFSLAGADKDISLEKKYEIIEQANRNNYLSSSRSVFVYVVSWSCSSFTGPISGCPVPSRFFRKLI